MPRRGYGRLSGRRRVGGVLRRVAKLGAKIRRRMGTYQSQVFTETYKANATSYGVDASGVIGLTGPAQGVAGKFLVSMKDIPQYQQYQNLYNMFKITKVTAIIIPKWNSGDPNTAQYNLLNSTPAWECPRMAYAINDNVNDLTPPTTELEVLEDNGAKIRRLTSPFKIRFSPRVAVDGVNPANTTQGVAIQYPRKPWIGFDGIGTTLLHTGVDWYVSCDNTASPDNFLDVADVYFKVSFICKDPR